MNCKKLQRWLPVGLLVVAPLGAEPEKVQEVEPIRIADRFAERERTGYQVTGPTDWRPGRLELSAGAMLAIAAEAEPEGELAVTLDFDESAGTETVLGFEVKGVGVVGARLSRGGVAGQTDSVAIFSQKRSDLFGGQRPRPLREFSVPGGLRSGRWSLGYRYGLVKVAHEGNQIAVALFGNLESSENLSPVSGMVVAQQTGRLSCRSLDGWVRPESIAFRRSYREHKLAVMQAYMAYLEANQLVESGRYHDALATTRRRVELVRRSFGEYHTHTADALNDLGANLVSIGDYKSARRCYERAIEILTATLGPDHPYRTSAMENLGWLLESIGDRDLAWPYLEQSLAIRRSVFGETHSFTAGSLDGLGSLLRVAGKYDKARPYLEEALRVREELFGPHHPQVASSLNSLAVLHHDRNGLGPARELYEKSLGILQEHFAADHPTTALVLCNLGTLHRNLGEHDRARAYYEKALAMRRQVLGPRHPSTAFTARQYGGLLAEMGRPSEARSHLALALDIAEERGRDLLPALSEVEALSYVQSVHEARDALLSVLREAPAPAAREGYLAVWRTRALATRAIRARRQLADSTPQAQALWVRLCDARRHLATVALASTGQLADDRLLALLTRKKEELERALANENAAFSFQTELERVGPDELAERLPGDAALVEIVRAWVQEHPTDAARRRWVAHYEAFVLRRGQGTDLAIDWVHLGAAEHIDAAIGAWHGEILAKRVPGPERETAPAWQLRRALWEPIEPFLGGAKTVVVIPDAALTRLPFAALPGRASASFLIHDYAIATANDGQQLAGLLDGDRPKGATVLLVGGIDYGVARNAVGGPAESAGWHPLPAANREVRAIAGLAGDSSAVMILSGAEATEARLSEQLRQKRFVHLATHGFFAEPRFRSALERHLVAPSMLEENVRTLGSRATLAGRSPLLLSGVVLARANASAGEGILTAEEVVSLDLRDTELVVLSACETGLGEVAGGEGVFGLQRAFALAGVRTTIAGLWKVDDEATLALMVEFYRNLWTRKMGKLEALRQAQLALLTKTNLVTGEVRGTIRKRARAADRPTDPSPDPIAPPPFYWAAFTLSGDWR